MSSSSNYDLAHINADWQAVDRATLLFVVKNERVLLIRKKRGLGAGKINGPGGKLDLLETAQQCAHREINEELCIHVSHSTHKGRLQFQFVDDYSIDVAVFVASDYGGTPTETDEAVPMWFALSDIPYAQMWADDILWLPQVLAGECVSGKFIFDEDRLLEYEVLFKP